VTPLPPPLGTGEIVAWRLDQTAFAAAWDGGEGAFRAGGRWNSRGVRAVYTALDPATAILEVAVHKGFAALDTVAHVLTAATVLDPSKIHNRPARGRCKSELVAARHSRRRPAGLWRRLARETRVRADPERSIEP